METQQHPTPDPVKTTVPSCKLGGVQFCAQERTEGSTDRGGPWAIMSETGCDSKKLRGKGPGKATIPKMFT